MDETVLSLGRGSRAWYRADSNTWQLAELPEGGAAATNGEVPIALLPAAAGGGSAPPARQGAPPHDVDAARLVPANPELQRAIDDMTQLSYLNEPSILDNLATRYGRDTIYTNAGPVLIAVNPCRDLPLYTPSIAAEYKTGAADAVNSLTPHIYLVAGAAFRNMVRQGASQSLVINGESGAGKTETTKKAMQFFAALAGGTGVEGQVLEVR